MDKKVRIGVVGCGGIANGKHLPAEKRNPAAELVAFCDIIEERAVKACKEYGEAGAKTYTDYKELLKDKSIDAVLVLTPNCSHCEITVAALEAGKLPPVVLQTVKAQRHIHGRSAPAGHCEGAHRPPIGQDPGGEPAAAQRDLLHLCPVRHRAEGASAPFFHTGLLSTRLRAAPAAVRRRVFAPLYRVFPPEARRLAPLLPGRAVSSRFFLRFSP